MIPLVVACACSGREQTWSLPLEASPGPCFVERIDPEGQLVSRTVYRYDGAGRVGEEEEGNLLTLNWYDEAGLLVRTAGYVTQDGGVVEPTSETLPQVMIDIYYRFDGPILRIRDFRGFRCDDQGPCEPTSRIVYSHDEAGRIQRKDADWDADGTFDSSDTCDEQPVWPCRLVLRTGWDEEIGETVDSAGKRLAYSYGTWHDGWSTVYAYDEQGRLESETSTSYIDCCEERLTWVTTYTYDRFGNLVASEKAAVETGEVAWRGNYNYDCWQ